MWTKDNITSHQGKTAVVTGANPGIRFQAALALYQNGAQVIVACRNDTNAEKAIAEMENYKGTGSLEKAAVDLSSLQSVRDFANKFKSKHASLAILINNAGVMIPPASKTEEGLELQFGVNFLGHFALTGLLYPVLQATGHARIVTVTSLAYRSGIIDFGNLRLEKEYDAYREYSQSKLADLLFSLALQDQIDSTGDDIYSLAAHPGITQTELSRNMSTQAYDEAIKRFGELMTAEQGALPVLYAAVADEVEKGGFYGPDQDGGLRGYPTKTAIMLNVIDKSTPKKLWSFAEEVTGVRYP